MFDWERETKLKTDTAREKKERTFNEDIGWWKKKKGNSRETNFTFRISIIVLYTFRISLNFHNVLPVTHRKKLYEVEALKQQEAFKELWKGRVRESEE